MLSIVEYFADHSGYKCGYCQSPDTNFSHGMWAHSLTVNDYQALIDRGWRRSGKYCYKPTLDVTCCPMYTIRCNATEFKLTKSQKKVLKRFNKYICGQDVSENHKECVRKMSTCSDEPEDCDGREEYVEATKQPQNITINNIVEANNVIILETHNDGSNIDREAKKEKPLEAQTRERNPECNNLKIVKKGTGPDPSKSPCKKAKDLRRERKLEKLKQKGLDITTLTNNKNKEKQLEDFINEVPDDMNKRLQLRLVRTSPPSQEWLASAEETHKVYVKYQTTIHNDSPSKCAKSKFMDFLVQSPLLEEYPESGPPCGFGSFHQQYLLDGKIVAVGVIDILPKCVSSVYFFYDPQYMNLTLGTYGALREIEFTRHLNKLCPELKYYYMGFYIHSCRKMRYKGNYNPSDLVCPETYNWIPLKDCIPKLEESSYSRLDPFIDNIDTNYPTARDIEAIKVWVNGSVKSYQAYIMKNAEDMDEISEYAKLVGAKSAKKLVLVRKA